MAGEQSSVPSIRLLLNSASIVTNPIHLANTLCCDGDWPIIQDIFSLMAAYLTPLLRLRL